MNEDIVETRGDYRPTVGRSESIDSVACTGVYPVTHNKKGLDLQTFESTIDRLPALPSVARPIDSTAECSGENCAIFPCGECENKRIGHAIARFGPGGAPVFAAK